MAIDRMKQIEVNVITNADVVDGHLILKRRDKTTLDCGPISEDSAGHLITVSASAPSSPSVGDIWIDIS